MEIIKPFIIWLPIFETDSSSLLFYWLSTNWAIFFYLFLNFENSLEFKKFIASIEWLFLSDLDALAYLSFKIKSTACYFTFDLSIFIK